MRKFILGAFAAWALCAGAAQALDWAGLYGGLQARYAWTKSDIDIPFYNRAPIEIDTEGASYGAFLGARWRLDERWSIGVEAEATWYDERERSPTGNGDQRYILEHGWAASVRALAAYDVTEETRVYGAAGIAFTEAGAAYSPRAHEVAEEPLLGWTVALGVEHDHTEHLTSRVELRYTAYEDGEFEYVAPSVLESDEAAFMIGMAWRFAR